MHLLKHFKELSLHPKNAKELKSLILQLAVQGKLTAKWRLEHPNVESASVLLERIRAEKAQMIKEKKIKKEKPLPEITEEEIPYELPEGWIWCRFQQAFDVRDGTHDSPKTYDGKDSYPLITSKDFKKGKIEFEGAKRISKEDYEEIIKRSLVEEDDILFSMIGGNIGNQVMVKGDANFAIKNVALFKYFLKSISVPNFLKTFTEHIAYSLQYKAIGGAQPFVSLTYLRNLLLPLPPLEEQKAIVEVVNQLFAEVEQLEELTAKRIQLKEDFATSALQQLTNSTGEYINGEWAFLKEHFPAFFTEQANVKKLHESILQLALQGKLTHHWRKENPDTEDASVLLDRIKAEKTQLIKEKEIKKEKPLPEITEEEKPYELPEGWVWCRMQEVGLFERGKSKHRPRNDHRLFDDGEYPLVQTGDVSGAKKNGGIINTYKASYNDFGLAQSRMWNAGTLCITIAANIAETGFLGFDACFPDSIVGFSSLHDDAVSQYVEYFVTVMKSDLEKYAPSTAQKNINLGILYELKFPLPPINEIKPIVEKVNALLGLCDQLEQSIVQGQTQVEQLMKSCLREVFEPAENSARVGQDTNKPPSGLMMAAEPVQKYAPE